MASDLDSRKKKEKKRKMKKMKRMRWIYKINNICKETPSRYFGLENRPSSIFRPGKNKISRTVNL